MNEEVKSEVQSYSWKEERFNDLVQIFDGENMSSKSKENKLKFLVKRYEDDLKDFISDWQETNKGNNFSVQRAKNHLNTQYEVPNSRLSDISGPLDLIIDLYKLESEGKIEEKDIRKVKAYAEFSKSKTKYLYRIDYELDENALEGSKSFEGRLRNWAHQYNKDKKNAVGFEIIEEEDKTRIKFYKETGKSIYRTFKDRNTEDDELEGNPDRSMQKYFPLKTLGLSIRERDGYTLIQFQTSPYDGWSKPLEDLFENVFGIEDLLDEMYPQRSKVAQDVHTEFIESEGDGREIMKDVSNTVAEYAEETIEIYEEDLSRQEEELLKDIEFAGFLIKQDQNTQTSEFRWVSNEVEDTQKIIDGIDSVLKSYTKEAEGEKVEVVLNVHGDQIRVNENTWTPLESRISQETLSAMRKLFREDE
ncbi:MAG: hypothetical protein ABEJ98_00570 [Candidatus Nanohaloarchaea archaeon]